MLVHRSAHALVETGGHPGVSSPLPILCFDRVAHCTWSFPTGWIGWTASPQIFLSPLSSVQLQKHTTMPSFFCGGQGSNLWSLYSKREQFSHQAISPALTALFSTLKMLIHCFFLCIVFHRTIKRNRFLVKGESSPVTV